MDTIHCTNMFIDNPTMLGKIKPILLLPTSICVIAGNGSDYVFIMVVSEKFLFEGTEKNQYFIREIIQYLHLIFILRTCKLRFHFSHHMGITVLFIDFVRGSVAMGDFQCIHFEAMLANNFCHYSLISEPVKLYI